jgi:N-acetylglucosaminyl-diphospho-decaprenol L-rhamnosyltransferase
VTSRVGVIVVCWNNADLIGPCLESVVAQDYPATHLHTYVVDNGSTDDSVALIADRFPDVSLVELGWNSGFAIANNVGIKRARVDHQVDYVVLLNSDATLSPNWITAMVRFADGRPRGACFQSLTVDGAQPDRVDSRYLYVNADLQAVQADYAQPVGGGHRTQRVYGVNAAAAMYNTAFFDAQPFDEVLDERMWMYLEDVDISTRALVMGWENWTVDGTTAQHLGSASTNTRTSGFAIRQTMRNQPILWLTNFPLRMILRGLPAVLRHDRGAIRHLLFTDQRSVIPQLLRGRMEGLAMIPYALRRRRRLAPLIRVSPDALEYYLAPVA